MRLFTVLLAIATLSACTPQIGCPENSAVTWDFRRNAAVDEATPHTDTCGHSDTVSAQMAPGGVLTMSRQFPRLTDARLRLFVNAQPACSVTFTLTLNNQTENFVASRAALLYLDADVRDPTVVATVSAQSTTDCSLFMGAGVSFVQY